MKSLFAAVILLGCLIGCGGGGSSTPSLFTGVWVDQPDNALAAIESNGHLAMAVADTVIGGTDHYTGTVHADGSLTGTVKNPISPSFTGSVTGQATLLDANDLELIVTVTYNGSSNTATAFFTKNTSSQAMARDKSDIGKLFGR